MVMPDMCCIEHNHCSDSNGYEVQELVHLRVLSSSRRTTTVETKQIRRGNDFSNRSSRNQ